MNVKYSWLMFVIPQIITIFQKNNGASKIKYPSISISFLDEESMHLFLMVFLIPCGWVLRLLIHLCLASWALMNVVDMADD